jgi:ribonuclease HI
MSETIAHIHTDGAARGNPGPAAWSFVIERPGQKPHEEAERLGETTNNVAEYTALVRALERAAALGLNRVAIFSDSELMVKQMNGEYAVKSPELRPLHDEARALRRQFEIATIAHVRRGGNKRADQLCNEVLNDKPAGEKPKKEKKPAKKAKRADIDADAVDCLRSAAQAWGRSGGASPMPELVWDQLWSILADAGIVK